MRHIVEQARLHVFMSALGRAAKTPSRIYLTGGASAVLLGWRTTTLDVDLHMHPEQDAIYYAFPKLKESLGINIEMASPSDFVPALPGWETRSRFILDEGPLSFYHYDFYGQALSKIERAHDKDIADVRAMITRGLVEPKRLAELFAHVEKDLIRYPAINPVSLRDRVCEWARATGQCDP